MTRMATLSATGRITVEVVDDELARLTRSWTKPQPDDDGDLLARVLSQGQLAALDLFDRPQLALVIRVCRDSRTLSAAGRTLFAASRAAKASTNDADRLKKYLARFGLSFDQLTG